MELRLRHLRLALAYLTVVALVGCGAKVTVDGTSSSTGAGGTGGAAGTAGAGGTAGTSGAGGAPGLTAAQCTCACYTLMSAGGCADLCANSLNGSMPDKFCDGSSALVQCAACLNANCQITNTMAQTTCLHDPG